MSATVDLRVTGADPGADRSAEPGAAAAAAPPARHVPAQTLQVRQGRQGLGGSRLLQFALANIRRRPERFVLSTAGIALALMAVVVVRTIAQGYATTGTGSLRDVLRGDPLWVVGAAGVDHDPALEALLPNGSAPEVAVPAGWVAHRTLAGVWAAPAGRFALYGRDDVPAGTAQVGARAAQALGVSDGATLTVAGAALRVDVVGDSRVVAVATDVARPVTGDRGWVTVAPPADQADRLDLGTELARAAGLPSTADPARSPDPAGRGLIYDTVGGGSSLVTFDQKFSALYASAVTGSTLGLVSVVGLVLGFVIAVTSFLASVAERRREFGIMSSIGLADEVLYFFLVESALVFVAAYVTGTLAAGAATALVVPGLTSWGSWLQAAGAVAAYLPAMAIVGALVPVHRLLQQRPIALLQDAP